MPLNIRNLILAVFIALLAACGGGGGGGGVAPSGKLALTVMENDGTTPIPNASVAVFDAGNGLVTTATTDADGQATITLSPEIYSIRVQAQGFNPTSPAVPFTIVVWQTLALPIELDPQSDATATARIFGNADVAGALIVAEHSTLPDVAVSGYTDKNGNYVLFNLVPGDYTVKAFKAGYQSDAPVITLADGDNTEVNLDVVAHAWGTLTGHLTFLAVANGTVDITLVHPITRDAIPGLKTENVGTEYTLNNVPAGDYLVWATFANDGYVMDPDWIDKNGGYPDALKHTMTASDSTKDFSITGATELVSPTNTADEVVPFEVNTLTPTFTWSAYPSAGGYAIEVLDLEGNSIWGGYTFDSINEKINFNPPLMLANATPVVFNFDASASAPLEDGKVYLWRITSVKSNTPGSYVAISSSEQQMGLFKVVLPPP